MAKAPNSAKSILQMDNLDVTQHPDGKVSLTFDPKLTQGMSKSGASKVICTTRGSISVLDFTVGLNVYRKAT